MNDYRNIISVIVPLYKTEEHRLILCLNSILMQTYKDLELIIINDGSPDKGPSICEEFALKDDRVKILHKQNAGVSSARNLGIENAIGKYICFVDSDDTIELRTLQVCADILENKSVDIVNFGMCFDKYTKGILRNSDYKSCMEIMTLESQDFGMQVDQLIKCNYLISSCNKVISTSLIKKNKISFDLMVHKQEDFIFNLQLMTHTRKIICIPQTFYHYYLSTNDSNSNRYEKNLFLKMLYVNHLITKLSKELLLREQNIQNVNNILFYNYSICLYNVVKARDPLSICIREVKMIINHDDYRELNNLASPASLFQRLIALLAKLNFPLGVFIICSIREKIVKVV